MKSKAKAGPTLPPSELQNMLKQAAGLHQAGQLAQAQVIYDFIVQALPRQAQALHARGVIAAQQGDHAHAAALMTRAIDAAPGNAPWHANRGIALRELGQLQAAVDDFDRALKLRPGDVEAWSNRAIALKRLGRLDAAKDSFERALRLQPQHSRARFNKSMLHLLAGEFETGWALYEARWQVTGLGAVQRHFEQPLWTGEQPLHGRTILLHAEQGLGDTIQFCRYARQVADRGARVVLEAQPPLLPLLQTLDGVAELVAAGSALPVFDIQVPLLSLPRAFGTHLANMPPGGAYLRCDPGRRAAWAARLGARTRPRVGIVWAGSSTHTNDRWRSLALADWLPHLPPALDIVSLQKEVPERDRQALATRADIRHFGNDIQDFADTAALCALVDVVVCVDTSVAHLAGALGRPTWVLLHDSPDWRWLLGRSDSPWYDTVRLFRQDAGAGWQPVLERVAAEWALLAQAG
jgi:tetratricopeptide (TPR) repeat protein